MNAPLHSPMRRGACPGLSAPMATGDGLLARLTPSGATISLAAFAGLCDAARRHGNGIVEVTSRGSIQFRGLSNTSAGPFAADVASLGIPANEGIAVMPDPLAGLCEDECLDAGEIAQDVRRTLASSSLASRRSAKVSVIVDGGGALHLDNVAADVRLRAIDGNRLHVAVGGTAVSATPVGVVSPDRATECVTRLLGLLASVAPDLRMRDAIASAGPERCRSELAGILEQAVAPDVRPAAEPVGMHRLQSGQIAVGVAPPFGHSDAETLNRLIGEAGHSGAGGLRTAPGRALLAIGLSPGASSAFVSRADALGFIVDPADPRRRVIACAGAPICASGEIPARALAPVVALAVRAHSASKTRVYALTDAPGLVHVSGCAKGCAHPSPAPVTIVGRDRACDIHLNGKLVASAPVDALPEQLDRLLSNGTWR
jgi:precorrin-3B synthase